MGGRRAARATGLTDGDAPGLCIQAPRHGHSGTAAARTPAPGAPAPAAFPADAGRSPGAATAGCGTSRGRSTGSRRRHPSTARTTVPPSHACGTIGAPKPGLSFAVTSASGCSTSSRATTQTTTTPPRTPRRPGTTRGHSRTRLLMLWWSPYMVWQAYRRRTIW
jgi:hypothetical protein